MGSGAECAVIHMLISALCKLFVCLLNSVPYFFFFMLSFLFITGLPTHSVGARLVTVTGVCHYLSFVGVCNTSICNVTHQEAVCNGGTRQCDTLFTSLVVYFLIYPCTPSRIDSFHFRAGGRRKRQNLAIVFCVNLSCSIFCCGCMFAFAVFVFVFQY